MPQGPQDVSGEVDYYRVLGVEEGASREEVVEAFRRLARASHPDLRPGDAAAAGQMRDVLAAYHVLGDESRRAAYDRARGAHRRDSGPQTDGRGTPIPVRFLDAPEAEGSRRTVQPRPRRDPGVAARPVVGVVPWPLSPSSGTSLERLLTDVARLRAALRRYLWIE